MQGIQGVRKGDWNKKVRSLRLEGWRQGWGHRYRLFSCEAGLERKAIIEAGRS